MWISKSRCKKKMMIPMPEDMEQAIYLERARKFAVTVIKQCQQQDYTIAQFNEFVAHLERRRQYLNSHVESVKMTDVFNHLDC